MTWTFIVNRRAPSLNDHVQNAGPSRWKYSKERDMWMLEFRKARLDLKIPRAIGKRRLVVTRMFCGREKERDYINLVGGMKSVVDALVLEGLLVDDKPAALEDAYRQVRFMAGKALTKGYVRFEISDCEQAVSGAGVST